MVILIWEEAPILTSLQISDTSSVIHTDLHRSRDVNFFPDCKEEIMAANHTQTITLLWLYDGSTVLPLFSCLEGNQQSTLFSEDGKDDFF